MAKKKEKPLRHIIGEQVIGYGAIGAAAVEAWAPAILAIDLTGAAGLASFGVLMATGRIDHALKGLADLIDGLR